MTKNLVDNDIVLKVAQYDLVNEFYNMAGSSESIYILPTLKFRYQLQKPEKALRYTHTQEALHALNDFVRDVNEINEEPPSEILDLLSTVDEVDEGEAILFILTAIDDESFTITGDKRALIAISSLYHEHSFIDGLNGRMKCLEQIIAEILLANNESSVIEKIAGKGWDNTLRACFSAREKRSILEGLFSYYSSLNRQCNSMLAPFPE